MTTTVVIISITMLPLAAFIYQSICEGERANTLLRYFQFGDALPKSSFFATLAASNSGLSASIYLITVYGYFYGLGVLPWIVAFWLCTQTASRLVIKRVEKLTLDSGGFISRHGTLHEFVGLVFKNRSIRIAAGVLSAITYLGLIACELLLGYEVVNAIVPTTPVLPGTRLELGAFGVILVIFILVAFYTRVAGFRAVIRTDKLQVALILAMLVSIVLLFIYIGPSFIAGYSKVFPTFSWNALVNPDGQGAGSFLVFFVLMNIIFWALWWPAAMDQWHRCAAAGQVQVALDKKFGTLGWISTTYFTVLSLICLLVGAALRVLVQSEGGEAAPLLYFIRYLTDSPLVPAWIGAVLIGLICAGLMSAVVSTIDSYMIVAIQSTVSDIKLAFFENCTLAEADGDKQLRSTHLRSAKNGVIIIAITTVFSAVILSGLSDIFAAIYSFFSLMLAVVPALVVTLLNRASQKNAAGILWSLVIGGFWAIFSNAYIIYSLEQALVIRDSETVTFYYNLLYANTSMTVVAAFTGFLFYEIASLLVRLLRRFGETEILHKHDYQTE